MATDDIRDLLHRRTDLGTFLVHFTRDANGTTARSNLLSILRAQRIDATSAQGMARHLDPQLHGTTATQRVACFTETPLEHCWMMVRDIADRRQAFQPYGVAFTKTFGRRMGCNPVWYLDITPGHTWLTNPITKLVQRAERDSGGKTPQQALLETQDIFQITPFIEQMGKPAGIRKEFWWEREWRHRGDFGFGTPSRVVCVLAPEQDHPALRTDISGISTKWSARRVPLLDPVWGLERMIAELAQVADAQDGPFPP